MKWFWLMMLWLKETATGLVRNSWGNLTAVLLTVACLTLFSVSYVTGLNAEHFAESLNDKIEIKAEVKDTVTDYDKWEKELNGMSDVEEVRFVSKEEAFRIMEKEMEDNKEVLYAVEGNPFPAKYVVKVKDPSAIDKVVKQVEDMGFASSVEYGREYVEKLVSFTKTLQSIGYVITLATALFTVYIVTNVIKYNIDKRKDELRIKRLTGAGMVTIRLPFILEALVITFLSSVAVYYLFAWGYGELQAVVADVISYAPFLPKEYVMDTLFLPLLAIALGIGFVGSWISTQRFIAKY